MLATLATLPIQDFTLQPSVREVWPDDGIPAFLKALSKVTSLQLALQNTKQSDSAVAAWTRALPRSLRSLSVNMQNVQIQSGAIDSLKNALKENSRLKSLGHVRMDLRINRKFSDEDKISLYQGISSGRHGECSLLCDSITDSFHKGLSVDLAAAACAGHGNCNAAEGQGTGCDRAMSAVAASTAVLLIGLVGIFVYRRVSESQQEIYRLAQPGMPSLGAAIAALIFFLLWER